MLGITNAYIYVNICVIKYDADMPVNPYSLQA